MAAEWLPAAVNGRTVINMVNLLDKPVEVKVMRASTPRRDEKPGPMHGGWHEVTARNLFSIGGLEKVRVLKSITPVLAEVGW